MTECEKLFSNEERNLYNLNIILQSITIMDLQYAITNITKAVSEKYDKNVLLLIDKYDTPILSSYEYGYYKELMSVLR